jgi:hypothetical protein
MIEHLSIYTLRESRREVVAEQNRRIHIDGEAIAFRERGAMGGLHHIRTAGNAARNLDFYTRVLGMRLIKKTVNFDDPETYHLYYGDEAGRPGTT